MLPRFLVFTDVDGCLLDSSTASFDAARPALAKLDEEQIPVVLVSSRTRAEMEPLRQQLNHRGPFIVENGGAVFVPCDTFEFPLERARLRAPYQVIEFGTPYALLRDVLKQIEETVRTPLIGFGDLSVDTITQLTGLPREAALRAKLREYDEPYLVQGPMAIAEEVCRQIVIRGLHWTKEGHFFHLTGLNNKGHAALKLLHYYRRQWNIDGPRRAVETVGIGGSLNDLPLLLAVDHPVLVQKADGSYDNEIDFPRLIHAPGIGPIGWNHAILDLLNIAA